MAPSNVSAAFADQRLLFAHVAATAGEVFAFAISERGNDRVMSDAWIRVECVDVTAGYAAGASINFTAYRQLPGGIHAVARAVVNRGRE